MICHHLCYHFLNMYVFIFQHFSNIYIFISQSTFYKWKGFEHVMYLHVHSHFTDFRFHTFIPTCRKHHIKVLNCNPRCVDIFIITVNATYTLKSMAMMWSRIQKLKWTLQLRLKIATVSRNFYCDYNIWRGPFCKP
jgi:hypothetical protein